MGPLVGRKAKEIKCQVVGLDSGPRRTSWVSCPMLLVVYKSNAGGHRAMRPGF
jgi:hypothetical protein